MSIQETTYKKPRIQKFKGKFKEISGGGTILFTKTLQSITDPDSLAVYVYLASKSPDWIINVKEIVKHFPKMGRDRVYKSLNNLCLITIIERKELRTDAGKFKEYQYYLYLEPLPEIQETVLPLPGLPDPAKPLTANQDTYKEEMGKERKESKKAFVKPPSIFDQQQYAHFLKNNEDIPMKYQYVKKWVELQEIKNERS